MQIQARSYVPGISAKKLVACAATMCCAAVHADNLPLSLSVSETLSRDNNLFRAEPGQYAIADTVSSTGLKLGMDKSYSRQRYVANLGTALNRYIDSTQLNNTSYDLNLAITSEYADKGLFQFDAGAAQQLARFDVANGNNITQTKNIQSTSYINAQTSYGGYGLLNPYLSINHNQQGFTYTTSNYQSYNQNTYGLGTYYKLVPQLSLGLGARLTRGDINNDQGNGEILIDNIRRRDIDLSANWTVSGLSSLYAQISATRSKDEYTNASNGIQSATSKGTTGQLSWVYTPQGKLSYKLGFIRDNGNIGRATEQTGVDINTGDKLFDQSINAENTRLSNNLNGKITFDYSPKLSINTAFSYTRYHVFSNTTTVYSGIAQDPGQSNNSDKSRNTQISLGGKYEYARWVDLYCEIKRLKRTEDFEYRPYNATVTFCTGQFNINGMN